MSLEESEKKELPVTFPGLGKGSSVFYETDRHEVWIGIPLRNAVTTQEGETIQIPIEPLLVSLALDRAKYESVAYLMQDRNSFVEDQQRKKTLTDKGILTRATESLSGAFKGFSAIGRKAVSLKL